MHVEGVGALAGDDDAVVAGLDAAGAAVVEGLSADAAVVVFGAVPHPSRHAVNRLDGHIRHLFYSFSERGKV